MNWLWWVGGGSAALILLAIVLYAFGFGGAIKVVRALTGFLGDTAESLRQWLHKPGNKLRGLCALFGFLFLAAGLQSWQRGTVIVQQRADYTALKAKSEHDMQMALTEIEKRDRMIRQFVEWTEAQKKLLDQYRADNAKAVAQAAEANARARESEAKYQEAFNQRPPECESALQLMAKACVTLKGY